MRLVDRGLEALIAPSGHATPWSGLAVLGAAAAGLAVLGMAAKDNPFFGLPMTDTYDRVQPNALTLRAFREAHKVAPGGTWSRPYSEWTPEEVLVFMDWLQDRGLEMVHADVDYFQQPHLRCAELNTPIRVVHNSSTTTGYFTEWRLTDVDERLAALDTDATVAALLEASALKGEVSREGPDTRVGRSHETAYQQRSEAILTGREPLPLSKTVYARIVTREPLLADDEANHTMLERGRWRADLHTSFVDYLMNDLRERDT